MQCNGGSRITKRGSPEDVLHYKLIYFRSEPRFCERSGLSFSLETKYTARHFPFTLAPPPQPTTLALHCRYDSSAKCLRQNYHTVQFARVKAAGKTEGTPFGFAGFGTERRVNAPLPLTSFALPLALQRQLRESSLCMFRARTPIAVT